MASSVKNQLEQQMNKLESMIDSCISNSPKKGSPGRQRNSPYQSRRQTPSKSSMRSLALVKNSRPVTAPQRTSRAVIRPDYSIPGASFVAIRRIYYAKCQDLNIPVLPEQENRFYQFCMKHISNRKINMTETGMGPLSAAALGQMLKSNSEFAYINLGKNTIADKGGVAIAKSLVNSVSVVHLDLSSNDISCKGSDSIISLLSNHRSLISLDISSHEGLHRNRVGLRGGEVLMKVLQVNPILQFLNLAGTSLPQESIENIMLGLANNRTLVSLNLANNSIGGRNIEGLAYSVATTSLKELNISNNQIGNEGAEFISRLLMGACDGPSPLEKLNISRNQITTKGISFVFEGLRNNTQLIYLDTSHNYLNLGPSSTFSAFLSDNSTCKTLKVACCELKNENLQTLGDGVGKNRGLTHLDLSENMIEDSVAEGIAQGLRKNVTLKVLDLSSNRIKDKGGVALADSLKINQTLEHFLLRENNLKDESGQLFSEVTRANEIILKLVLDYNPINYKYINDVKQNLKKNKKQQTKKVVPRLKMQIQKMQIDDKAINRVKHKISVKRKEYSEAEQKLERQNERLEEIKLTEEQKLQSLKEEYSVLKDKNIKLSESLDSFNEQCTKKKIELERQIQTWSDKVAYTVAEIKQNEKKSKI